MNTYTNTRRPDRVPTTLFLAVTAAVFVPTLAAEKKPAAAGSGSEATYLRRIDELLPAMAAERIVDRREAQLIFEKLCFEASAPDRPKDRKALCEAIMKRVGPDVAKPARVWLLRKVEPIGRDEVVPGLTRLLGDPDAEIRELARRALQNNPSPKAAAALRKELGKAKDDAWKVALINALAFRHDAESAKTFVRLADDQNPATAKAAITALGDLADAAATAKLTQMLRGARPELRQTVIDAALRAAEQAAARGDARTALSIYEPLASPSEPERVRMAALAGLASVQKEKVLPRLIEIIKGNDPRMRLAAASFAQTIPGTAVTQQLAEATDGAPADVQIVLLDVLAHRGDPSAVPEILERLDHADQAARIAALRALGQLGNASVVAKVASVAARAADAEREAARAALVRMRGSDVDQTILKSLDCAEGPVRAELIRAAAARRIAEAVPMLYAATNDPDESVRVAVLEALGRLGTEKDVEKMVSVLVSARGEATRKAAEDALVAICSRTVVKDGPVSAVAAAMAGADTPGKVSLIRVLGQLQGPAALEALKEAYESGDDAVKTAAVAAGAGWSSPEPMDDLLYVLREDESAERRSMALKGYVRMVRMSSDRAPSTTFAMLKSAMELSTSPEDKKLVLAALADAPCLDALQAALACVEDPALKTDAQAAAIAVAVRVSGQNYADAMDALGRIEAAAATDDLRKRASGAVDALRRFCVTWQFSGPYRKDKLDGPRLFDEVFLPEQPEAKAEWRPLPVGDPGQPGRFMISTKESACCGYAKASVWVEKQTDARLGLGSDDGIKAWLNGQLVHANNATRGLQVDQDLVPVQLKAGWNTLLLKITQGGGDWAFSCSVTMPDGRPIPGIKFEAR